MRKFVLTLLLNVALGVATAMAGGISGPVDGTWRTGDQIVITGPCFVPSGKSLSVEPGVEIRFETTDAFMIFGSLHMEGYPERPIVLYPSENWEGFLFKPSDPTDCRTMFDVIIAQDSPMPRYVVVGDTSWLHIRACKFRAYQSCIYLRGGRLQAISDTLITVGMYSKVIRLENLTDDIGEPCNHVYGNKLQRCFLKADVPISMDTLGFINDFTAGLFVNSTNSICFSDSNAIIVRAPQIADGVHFVGASSGVSGMIVLDSSIVTVRSLNGPIFLGTPRGVYLANSGFLRVLHCSIDIGREDQTNDNYPYGVVASRDASIEMNSSILRLDYGDRYFSGINGGLFTVNFSDISSSIGFLVSFVGPHNKLNELDDGMQNSLDEIIILGPDNIYSDPQWRREGQWGEWNSFEDVYAYYSLLPSSPCINSADAAWGYDPDNSLPDIGCFYYHSLSTEPDHVILPSNLVIQSAYPNPFNPVTVVPFELRKSGFVSAVVYDPLGRRVADLFSGVKTIGTHRIVFSGDGLSSGVYVLAITLDGYPAGTQKVILLK